RGRVLDALTDVNGDGVPDLVIASFRGRRLADKRSAVEVHFGARSPAGGIAFGSSPDTVIDTDGVQLGIQRHDLDRDGQLDMMVTTIGTQLLRGTLFRRFAGFMGGEIHLQLELFRMDGGHYPDAPDATRRINLQYPGAHRGPGWVPLDMALRGATHERRLVETTHPRAFNTPVLLGDVTGDGRADLIVGRDRGEPPGPLRHADDSLHVFVGEPGPDLFSRQPHEVVVPLPEDGEYVWLTDLDRDGRQDIVMHHPAAAEPHRVTVLMARQIPAPAPPD
ncbi:MAG: VCBS repeat-containing protein, partial [Acidobacteria bacterium]|nr:VCBS repeat-containing protein [Acidobacteriota bacterium]